MFRGMALARWLKETKSIRRPPISVPLEKEMLFQVPVRKDTNMDYPKTRLSSRKDLSFYGPALNVY